jgi:hypothetical protein
MGFPEIIELMENLAYDNDIFGINRFAGLTKIPKNTRADEKS